MMFSPLILTQCMYTHTHTVLYRDLFQLSRYDAIFLFIYMDEYAFWLDNKYLDFDLCKVNKAPS